MNALVNQIRKSAREFITKQAIGYVQEKYGVKAEACIVWGEGQQVMFKTSTVQGNAREGKLPGWEIRNKVGQNMLLKFALPMPDEQPHRVVLVPLPSLLTTVGPWGFYRFVKDWVGFSYSGELPVVEYSVLK